MTRIHPRSDLVLAAWGLDDALYFKAIARLQDIDPEFSIDLIQPDQAYSALRSNEVRVFFESRAERGSQKILCISSNGKPLYPYIQLAIAQGVDL